MKNILIIGGAGYVGTMLSDHLSNHYNITVFDLFIYGDHLNNNKIKKIKGDIRDIDLLKKKIKDFDAIIHLACISNDPSFDLNPELGKSINYDPFEDLVKISKDSGVKRFVYASSSSVYGLKDYPEVNEDASLEPLTDYSVYKAKCEEILLKYDDKNFITTIIRPATVCGFSRRQRFDLVVNILTNNAYYKNEITIFGGKQLRPNINIKDMCNAYEVILFSPTNLVKAEIFNVGFENHSVENLAHIVERNIKKRINIVKQISEDQRSYHISSNKIKHNLNFRTKYDIEDGVLDLIKAFDKNLFTDTLNNEMYFNIKRMKSINLK